MSESQYVVEIVEDATEKVVKSMGPMPQSRAEKVADGVMINLDHDRFHVRLKEQE